MTTTSCLLTRSPILRSYSLPSFDAADFRALFANLQKFSYRETILIAPAAILRFADYIKILLPSFYRICGISTELAAIIPDAEPWKKRFWRFC
jgi:hypothetical protein